MQNVENMRELFKLAAREAKAKRVASMTLLEQTIFILLVAGKQAKARHQYTQALEYRLTWAVCKASSSMAEAWSSLQSDDEVAGDSDLQTPASNTGVTESAAQVPMEYFTRGR